MKAALHYFRKYLDWYIYRSDTFWKLKYVKNIEMMNLINIETDESCAPLHLNVSMPDI
jgi:hypothetical protein